MEKKTKTLVYFFIQFFFNFSRIIAEYFYKDKKLQLKEKVERVANERRSQKRSEMTENYENDIVFAKRLSESNDLQQQQQQQQNQMICNERAKEYIRELNAERNRMDKKFPIADRLIEIGKLVSQLFAQFSQSDDKLLVCIDFPTFPSALELSGERRKLFFTFSFPSV